MYNMQCSCTCRAGDTKPFLRKLRFLPDDVAFKSPARLNAQVGLNVVIIML